MPSNAWNDHSRLTWDPRVYSWVLPITFEKRWLVSWKELKGRELSPAPLSLLTMLWLPGKFNENSLNRFAKFPFFKLCKKKWSCTATIFQAKLLICTSENKGSYLHRCNPDLIAWFSYCCIFLSFALLELLYNNKKYMKRNEFLCNSFYQIFCTHHKWRRKVRSCFKGN